MRKFWIMNAKNQKWSLHDKRCFAESPTGLGFKLNVATTKLGDSELVTFSDNKLDDISLNILFLGSLEEQYEDYFNLVNFLNYTPIRLFYLKPNINEPYFCHCSVVSIDKSEVGEDNILRCPAIFKMLTFWQTEKINTIKIKKFDSLGKKYKLTRKYAYGLNSFSQIPILNYGLKSAPFEIIINGACKNPQFSLFDENGTKYGCGKLIGVFDYIYINSEDDNESIILKRDGAVLPNPFNYQDLSIGQLENVDVTFLKLKPGKNSLSILIDIDFSGEVEINWRNRYGSI
ncbi:MAG: hypothetical protein RR945_02160 [Erysipelotrichaceae bacterium]